MSCIKTGARVYFQEYGFVTAADIYAVGNALIIRWMVGGKFFCTEAESKPSHVVRLGMFADNCWHRDDLGVTVVPAICLDTVI